VGLDLLSAGEIDVEGRLEAIVSQDEAKKTYRKLVVKDNVIIGAILLGDLRGSAEILSAIQKRTEITPFKADLAMEEFDFARLR
jgi:nitrite reductase (NADH) large subunit